MRYRRIAVILMAAIAIASITIFFDRGRDKKTIELPELTEQQNADGSVAVFVTPRVSLESGNISFNIVLDTHSEELLDDFIAISVLRDKDGREYKPVSWVGDKPGGHHRKGTLAFAAVPYESTLTLVLKSDTIGEKVFQWNL